MEAKSGAPNVGKYDESFKSTSKSTDIRTHFTDVNWHENKRGEKRAPRTRSRGEENNRENKVPFVAECHGEHLRERGKRDNYHKRKYIIANTQIRYNMYYGEFVSASIYKRYTHKSTETADVNITCLARSICFVSLRLYLKRNCISLHYG